MKQIILGILIGMIIGVPSVALADRVIKTPTTNPVYNIASDSHVSVFDDQDNKCYVVSTSSGANGRVVAISCVKEAKE